LEITIYLAWFAAGGYLIFGLTIIILDLFVEQPWLDSTGSSLGTVIGVGVVGTIAFYLGRWDARHSD
jgi:hypothetical protein